MDYYLNVKITELSYLLEEYEDKVFSNNNNWYVVSFFNMNFITVIIV